MNNLHGIIFAYGESPEMRELTQSRNICSLPFGGRYRLVDFTLSSMVNAGVTDVGVIVHTSYQSLLDHLGSGKEWDLARKRGGLRILPPFSYAGRHYRVQYRGRMEALAGVHSYLEGIKQDYVVLADADVAANLPIDDIFASHLKSGADITTVCVPKADGDPRYSNYFTSDQHGFVTEMAFNPFSADGQEGLEMYIMSKDLLISMVDYAAAHSMSSFGDTLMTMRGRLRVATYVHHGYAARIHSVNNYFRYSMDLLKPEVRADLFCPERPIRTKDQSNPSTFYAANAVVTNSLVADGCSVEGTVINSVLARGVRVAKGARVENCVLLQRTEVQEGSTLRCAITDKNVTVSAGQTLMGSDTYPLVIAKNQIV